MKIFLDGNPKLVTSDLKTDIPLENLIINKVAIDLKNSAKISDYKMNDVLTQEDSKK